MSISTSSLLFKLTLRTSLYQMLYLSAFSILTLASSLAQAQFTAGRIVVVQTAGSVSKASSPVTLREYQIDGTTGTSIAIPATGVTPLQMAAGSGGSEGFLTRSPDGTTLVLAGYSISAAVTDITTSSSSTTPRVIFQVDAAGNYNQVGSNASYNANDIRGAITDGTNYWASGASNATDGINYYGPGTPINLAVGAKAYGLQIFNNQIYFSTQKTGGVTPNFGVYSLGTGTPTSGSITPVSIINTGTATPEDFSINPSGDVCYIAINMNTSVGGIQKWVNNGTAWNLAYTLGTGVTNIGAYGLVVDYSGNDPVLYATTFEANTIGNRVIKITDTGVASTATTLVTGTANTFFHGIAFAPTCALPSQPDDFTVSSSTVNPGQNNVTFTVPNASGVTYNWDYSGVGETINGTGNSVTINFSNASTAGNLTVSATNGCGTSAARSKAVTIAGAMRITEFMYNPATTGGEFVEFTNIGGTAVDMTGWSFDDISRTSGSENLSGFGIVQPGESVIFTELTVSDFKTKWNLTLCPNIKIVGGNTNGLGREDEINLYDASNALVDRLTYGDQTYSPGSIRTQGKSGWVNLAGLGSNDITKWTFSSVGDSEASYASTVTDIGSPGKSTLVTVAYDPCAIANGAPTISFDLSTSNYLDGGISIAPLSPFAVSGAISDPTDPAATLGINFTIGDEETPINDLTVTAISSSQAVVLNTDIIITGTGVSRNIKITPHGVGLSTLMITVNDGTNNTSYTLNYAASAASATPANTVWHTGISDGSEAVALDDNYYIVNDDELNVLNVYSRSASGLPLVSYEYTANLNLPNLAKPEVDLEAAAASRVNVGKVYWLGSMSNTKAPFNDAPNRNRLFATTVTGTGTTTTFTFAGYYGDLRAQLLTWGDSHGYDFTTSAAAGMDSKAVNGFAAEGMVFGPDNTTLYIGLRAPLIPTATRTKAVIAPIVNFETWFNNGSPSGNPTFAEPIELDMGGRGVRGMIRMANGVFIIVAGNPLGDPITSAIYKWTGHAADQPVLVSTSANNILNMEGVMEVYTSGDLSKTDLQVISDGGDDIIYNNSTEAKDFADLGLRKFRSDKLSVIDLCINTSSTETASDCIDYTWNGTTYTETGTYTEHFENQYGCDSASTLDLTISSCTVIENATSNVEIQLVPNPNAGQVKIITPTNVTIKEALFYSMSGEQVKTLSLSGTENNFNLYDLKAGMYQVIFKDDQGNQWMKKMVKN